MKPIFFETINYLNYWKSFARGLLVIALLVAFGEGYQAEALTVSPVRIEISGDAGNIVTSEIQLFNELTTPNKFYFSFANFDADGDTGTPVFTETGTGLSTWITTPESIELKPGEQKKIPIAIRIPDDTKPGGYFAGIFLSTTPATSQNGGTVAIGAKVGILVLLRVNGEIEEKGGVVDFGTDTGKKLFTTLPINFAYRFQNSGGDRIQPNGSLIIRNIVGIKSATLDANAGQGNILPFGGVRKFLVVWAGKNTSTPAFNSNNGFFAQVKNEFSHFKLGPYHAVLNLAYGEHDETAHKSTWIFVLPWHLLILIAGGLMIIIILAKFFMHRYNTWVILQAEQLMEAEHPELAHHDAPVAKTKVRDKSSHEPKPKTATKRKAPRAKK